MKKLCVLLLSTSVMLAGCGGDSSDDNKQGDSVAPTITLNGAASITLEYGSSYEELGATAVDAVDGAVSVDISNTLDLSVLGTYVINYTASDSSGNTATATREVNVVDTTPPVINLIGGNTIELLASETYEDPTTATDGYDGEIAVETSGDLDTNSEGTYTVTYTATDTSGNTASETRTIQVLASDNLNIQAKNYFTGEPIPSVDISVNSIRSEHTITREGSTDTSGSISILTSHDATKLVVNADARGYGEYSTIAYNGDNIVTVFLQPVNATVEFSASAAASLDVEGQNIVTLPANAIVDENGNVPSGNISAEITIIDPSVDPSLMPGNYETVNNETGEINTIESFGAVSVQFVDDANNQYNLATGQTATIRIPATGTTPPSSIPLYYFDRESGYWIEEGTATLTADDSGNEYFEGNVSHFTTWNADITYDSIQIQGCVIDTEGTAILNADVSTQGNDYLGQSWARTDINGGFSIAAKKNASVLLSVKSNTGASRTLTIDTDESDYTVNECMQLAPAAAVITLTWGENPRDLDTHFFGPNSELGDQPFTLDFFTPEVLLGDSTIWLDVDDVYSYGPEVTTISSLPYAGRYSYAVYHFFGEGDIASSPARVKLEYAGQTQVFSPPAGAATECWAVFDFVVSEAGTVTVEPVARWTDEAYCHAEYYDMPQSIVTPQNAMQKNNKALLPKMIKSKYYDSK
ncbi:immunoglobulin-like domain-containing protein [Shewanella sp.]|uniref:immunoglobulin-like domain-containing protein n=1 Tax=Shewanella sp. TaxID=50422 RepID=UPI003A97A921